MILIIYYSKGFDCARPDNCIQKKLTATAVVASAGIGIFAPFTEE